MVDLPNFEIICSLSHLPVVERRGSSRRDSVGVDRLRYRYRAGADNIIADA